MGTRTHFEKEAKRNLKWPNDIQLNKFNDVRHVRSLPFTSIPFGESMEGMNTTKKK